METLRKDTVHDTSFHCTMSSPWATQRKREGEGEGEGKGGEGEGEREGEREKQRW